VRVICTAGPPWTSSQPPPIEMPERLDNGLDGDGLSGTSVATQSPRQARRDDDQRRHHHQNHRRYTSRSHHRSNAPCRSPLQMKMLRKRGHIEIERLIDRFSWAPVRIKRKRSIGRRLLCVLLECQP
jgi:hypothetical protein